MRVCVCVSLCVCVWGGGGGGGHTDGPLVPKLREKHHWDKSDSKPAENDSTYFHELPPVPYEVEENRGRRRAKRTRSDVALESEGVDLCSSSSRYRVGEECRERREKTATGNNQPTNQPNEKKKTCDGARRVRTAPT
jgi:hypothetical protein